MQPGAHTGGSDSTRISQTTVTFSGKRRWLAFNGTGWCGGADQHVNAPVTVPPIMPMGFLCRICREPEASGQGTCRGYLTIFTCWQGILSGAFKDRVIIVGASADFSGKTIGFLCPEGHLEKLINLLIIARWEKKHLRSICMAAEGAIEMSSRCLSHLCAELPSWRHLQESSTMTTARIIGQV